MSELLKHAAAHPMTCVTLALYASNIVWYLVHRQWGLALYWAAASQITFAATWLLGWRS